MKFFSILGIFCIYVFFYSNYSLAKDSKNAQIQSHWRLANSFYQQNQYYRSISELYRLKFYYGQHNLDIDGLLAKNYYWVKDYSKLISLSNRVEKQEIIALSALALLQVGDLQNAKNYWETAKINEEFYTPPMSLLNPQQAFWLSLFPGAGFFYTKNYSKAIGSFLLNSIFFYGIIRAFAQEQYATSYLLFFFEYQFYTGGMRAAKEQAEIYNQEVLQKERKIFIQLYEKKFGAH